MTRVAQIDLANDQHTAKLLDLPGADVTLFEGAVSAPDADRLFAHLMKDTAWREGTFKMFDRTIPIPRLTAWYGDFTYRYSGTISAPKPWPAALLHLKDRVERLARRRFRGVLLNLYRDGRDSVAWHSDDERGLGAQPLIASVSLGATRRFQFRQKQGGRRLSLDLHHGDVLIMGGATQRRWQHQVPKAKARVGPRINLTFRTGE